MKFQRPLTVLAIVCVCVGSLFAQDKKKDVDPSGTWRWEYDMEGQTIKDHAVLQLEKDGKVTGTMHSTIRDEALTVKKGTWKDGKLTFAVVAEYNGTPIDLLFDGKLNGDELAEANVKVDSEQGTMDLPWAPKRSVEMSDVLGEWHFVYELPDGGESEGTMTITEKDKKLVGEYKSDHLQSATVKKLEVAKNKLAFQVTGSVDGNDIVGDASARPYGNNMKGMLDVAVGSEDYEVPFIAKRKVAKVEKSKE